MNDISKYVQDCIDGLTNEIIQLEDDLKILEKNKLSLKNDNEKMVENLNKDIEKNIARLDVIKNLKESDQVMFESAILNKGNELKYTNQKILESQNEIAKMQESQYIDPLVEINAEILTKQNKLNLEQKKEKYSRKINDLRITIEENRMISKSNNEKLLLMKEDKTSCRESVVNLISQKETIEELIRNYHLFPNLNKETCEINETIILPTFENLTIKEAKTFEFYSYEIKIVKLDTVLNNLFLYFNNQMKIVNREKFNKICEHCFKFVLAIDVEDFFHLLTKKLYDYFKIETENSFFLDNEEKLKKDIDLEKIMTALKMIFKVAYLDEVLEYKHIYISKSYKSLRNQIKGKIKETELININLERNLSKYEEKMKSLEINHDLVQNEKINKSILDNEKSNLLLSLNLKFKALILRKNEIDSDLNNLKIKYSTKISNYDSQINEIEKLNKELIERKDVDINTLYEKIDQQIFDYKTIILDKKLKIREFISKVTNNEVNQKTNLVNSFLRKINDTLERSNLQDTNSIHLKKESSNLIINPVQESIVKNNHLSPEFFSKSVVNVSDKFPSSPFANRTVSNFKDNNPKNIKKTSIKENSVELTLEDLDKLHLDNKISKTHSNFAKKNEPNLVKTPSQTDPNMKFFKPIMGKSSSSINLIDEKYKEVMTKNIQTGENYILPVKTNLTNQKKTYYIPYQVSSRNKSFNSSNTNLEERNKKENELKQTNSFFPEANMINPKIIVNFRYDLCSPQEFSILEILKPLLEGTVCLKRIFNKSNKMEEKKFNPLDKINDKDLYDYFQFKRCFVYCDKSLKKFIFQKPGENKKLLELYFNLIESFTVPKTMTNIITIHKLYKKLIKQNTSLDVFFESYKTNNYLHVNSKLFNKSYRESCLKIKYFVLEVTLNTGIIFELVFFSYKDYKSFLKGIELILNDKTKLVKYKNKII